MNDVPISSLRTSASAIEPPAEPRRPGRKPFVTVPATLTARLLLLATLGALPVLGLAGILLQWLFTDHITQQFDTYLAAYQQELVAGITIGDQGHLQTASEPLDPRFNLPFSGWYWQVIHAGKIVAQSRSIDPVVVTGKKTPYLLVDAEPKLWAGDLVGPGSVPVRVIAASIRLPGGTIPFQVIVSGPSSEIDRQTASFGKHLALILGALGLAFLVATSLQIRFGLSPLRRLQGELQQIRSGIAAHLSDGYPAEVAPLAEELNAVLDHNSALIERARMQAGNLAHALKTPLSVIRHEVAGLVVTGDSGGKAVMREQLDVMARQIDRTLARIRMVGPDRAVGSHCNVTRILRDLVFSMELLHRDRALRMELVMPMPLAFAGDEEDLMEILGNLLDNACKWARSHVRVSAFARAIGGTQKIRLLIEDDGPGIPAAQRSLALLRGLRLDETKPGSGLGLDIVRETAELYGGSLLLGESSLGGLSVELLLAGSFEPVRPHKS